MTGLRRRSTPDVEIGHAGARAAVDAELPRGHRVAIAAAARPPAGEGAVTVVLTDDAAHPGAQQRLARLRQADQRLVFSRGPFPGGERGRHE